ncbi:MAG: glycine cleavage system protein GcvH [Saprospiraceae bacterium]|jgi:glycine cleavage system H protein
MEFPKNCKYTNEHEWVLPLGDGTALVGITDFAQSELGSIVYVEVETVGEDLSKDQVFGVVEAVKTTSDLFMPVGGTVIEFNPEVDGNEQDNPAIINDDPYDKGWIIKIRMNDPSELNELMDHESYQKMVE